VHFPVQIIFYGTNALVPEEMHLFQKIAIHITLHTIYTMTQWNYGIELKQCTTLDTVKMLSLRATDYTNIPRYYNC